MSNNKSRLRQSASRGSFGLFVASILVLLPFIGTATAQSGGTIETGVTIPVRTLEEIKVTNSDGRIFVGEISQDVRDTRGSVALPRGADVELLVRSISSDEYVLDLESVTLNGRRLAIDAENSGVITAEKDAGLGANERTGKYVGGGAIIGAIIGAIAGGGKGAAIGGGVGAAAGAGTQVLTKGKNVAVPSETLVTFRLERPLRTGIADTGFSRNGNHYHTGYGTLAGNTAAYDAGLKAGRSDRERRRTFDSRSTAWRGADLRDYQDGYERGFDESPARTSQATADIRIGADHYVRWKGPARSQVYVQVDNNQRRLFSSEASGTQPAPWISSGHKYVFLLVDANGREIVRDENDLHEIRRR